MKKKKVVIITYGYPPFNAPSVQRPYTLAKYLDKTVYEVVVITCPNADSSLGYDPNFDETLEDVSLLKVPAKFSNKISGFRAPEVAAKKKTKSSVLTYFKKKVFALGASLIFPDKGVFWYRNVLTYLAKNKDILENCAIVFTSSPLATNHNLGSTIKIKYPSIKWVAEFEDYHYLENWSHKKGFLASLHKKFEKKVMQGADQLTFVSETMKNNYQLFYPAYANKCSAIYNGYDADNYAEMNYCTLGSEKLIITYAGSFYKGIRSPIPLLQLLDHAFSKGVISINNVSIQIAGNFEPELLTEAKQYQSFDCINFLGKIPRAEVLRLFTNSHLLWLIVGNKIPHYTSVPLKLFEYLAARRTIVNFAPHNAEASAIIERYNLGVNFDMHTEDRETLQQKFIEVLDKFKNNEFAMPLDAQEIDIFSRRIHARQFETIFER